MCQEISHGPPIIPQATPATMHQIVHGTDSAVPALVLTHSSRGGLAICCPNGIDCPIVSHSPAVVTNGIFTALPRVYTDQPFLNTASRSSALPPTLTVAMLFTFLPFKIYGTSARLPRLYFRGLRRLACHSYRRAHVRTHKCTRFLTI